MDNRTEILNVIMTESNVLRDDAKQLGNQLLYFGTFESWLKNHNKKGKKAHKFITKCLNELNMIVEIIIANNPTLSKAIKKTKTTRIKKNIILKVRFVLIFY